MSEQEPVTATKHRLSHMPSFTPHSLEDPGEEATRCYEDNGVVCLRNAIPPQWVDTVARGMDISQTQNDPEMAFTIKHPGEPGHFYYDTFMWKRIDEFDRFFRESPAPASP